VEYFLEMIARVFPSIKVGQEDIVFRFSGVRPLAASNAKTTGQITRDHEIEVSSGEWTGLNFPVYSLVGGKWTSYRAFSEQVTDKALSFLGLPRHKNTRELPIGGGRGYPAAPGELKRRADAIAAWSGMNAERAQVLLERMNQAGISGRFHRAQPRRGSDLPLQSTRACLLCSVRKSGPPR
jgi:glycerol-3-phosphate dehydrogenase